MIDCEDSNFTAINQTYKIWKKHAPFLYNLLQTYSLPSCSQSIDSFSDYYLQNDWKITNLLIGTNSLAQNSVVVLSVGLPTNDALTDYTSYRQQIQDVAVGGNGYIGVMGAQAVTPKITIPQASEIMRARINRQDENIIAVKTGGATPQLLVYDLRNKEEELEQTAIKLPGHECEGFGLAWSPLENTQILSGSYDKKIILYNVEQQGLQGAVWNASEGVEDVKWSNFNPSIFASAQQDEKICLYRWDARVGEDRASITRKAHTGEVYSLDFNKKSEHLLISGGEDGDVCFWDLRNMSKKLHTFVGHNDAVNTVAWNPQNSMQFVSGSSDRRVVVWDVERLNLNTQERNGNQILFIHGGHRSKVTDLCWGRDKELVFSSEENNTVQGWRMNERVGDV